MLYPSLLLCSIPRSRVVSYTMTFRILICRFKLMNMSADRREQSQRWETHFCHEMHNKVEQIVEDSHSLWISWFNGDNYEVLDKNHNAISLRMRKCSCYRWEVYALPCKHAWVAIMQTNANVHRYVDEHFTVDSYRYTYPEPIYPIPDYDKPTDDKC